ncbi:MAG TPA: hypothetical protein P5556_03235 [Candidatus Gastranaerophilales bacterium]|nr:hypothetical protein [Candidatus Gastranaerophilales bacterium]
MVNNIHHNADIKSRTEGYSVANQRQRPDKALKAVQKGFITDTYINGRENEDSVFINSSLPKELKKNYDKDNRNAEKTFISMAGIPLGVLGAGALATGALAGFYKKKLNPEAIENGFVSKIFRGVKKIFNDNEKGPILPPNINIKTESQYAAYEALRDPSLKKILGAMAVITFSSAAFVLKNTVDGMKEIWVKKREADIQRNFQENMIDIETRSFSGKKQIVRYLTDEKTKELDTINKAQNISFAGNKQDKESFNSQSKPLTSLPGIGIAVGAVAASVFLIKKTMKNIRTIGQIIDDAAQKTSSSGVKESSWAPAHEMYGNKNGKPTVFAYLDDVSGHLYNMIMNPSKFTGSLFAGLATVSGLGYAGSKFVEAHKETQVKKANAETDLNMHDKLVGVELKNFITKKEVAVKPLIDEYKILSGKDFSNKENLKLKYNGIIEEIKNGPPFIYD